MVNSGLLFVTEPEVPGDGLEEGGPSVKGESGGSMSCQDSLGVGGLKNQG